MEMTSSVELSRQMATSCSGAADSDLRWRASWLALSFNSEYVNLLLAADHGDRFRRPSPPVARLALVCSSLPGTLFEYH